MTIQEEIVRLRSGIELHTVIAKNDSANGNPTLLLLHFWGGSNRTYHSLVSRLAAQYNIIAPSLRGWGKSSKPTGNTEYRIDDHVEDLKNLLSSLRSSHPDLLTNGVVVVGHSMGGKLSQVLVAQPELSRLLRGCILLAPAPSGSFSLPEDMKQQQISAYKSTDATKFVVENVLLGAPESVSHEEIDAVVRDAVAGSEGAKEAWPGYAMAEDHEAVVGKAVQRLGRFPVLIVVGELDRVETPSNVEARVAGFLRAAGGSVTSRTLPGVGHLIPLEAPETLGRIIDEFIAGVSNQISTK